MVTFIGTDRNFRERKLVRHNYELFTSKDIMKDDERKDLGYDQKRDQLITETLLRLSSLEKLLIAKGLVTQEEISGSFLAEANKLIEVMRLHGGSFDASKEGN